MIDCRPAMPRLLLVLLIVACAGPARASVFVRFETVLGDFDVELFDDVAPLTVANFLAYVRDEDYDDSFIHRSIPGFVIQGGGYAFAGNTIFAIPQRAPVENEFEPTQPLHSSIRGRIAMAKPPGQVNNATNQWFINLADNSADLDGDFTAFGEVMGEGMDVVDGIAALPTFPVDLPGPLPVFQNFPLFNYTGGSARKDNFVIVSRVTELPEPGETALRLGALASLLLVARLRTRRRAAGPRP